VVTTAEEAVKQAAALKDQCDALFIGPITKVVGAASGAFTSEQVLFAAIRPAFGKATFTIMPAYVKAGLLGGVGRVPEEPGQVAAEMLKKAMSGTPLADLPITQNQFGKRSVNNTGVRLAALTRTGDWDGNTAADDHEQRNRISRRPPPKNDQCLSNRVFVPVS